MNRMPLCLQHVCKDSTTVLTVIDYQDSGPSYHVGLPPRHYRSEPTPRASTVPCPGKSEGRLGQTL